MAFLLCITFAFGGVAFAGCENDTPSGNAYYTVVYDLNYEGAGSRAVSVQAGTAANEWRANRAGYLLNGWYTDEACRSKFDFGQAINKNRTLYAGWRENPGTVAVTFDFGYDGAEDVIIEVEKDTRIQDRYIPEHDRLGMTFTGWYADAGLTEEWDFSADQVNDNMTLYAGYEYDPSYLERDENGDIVYNNVNVQVWNAMHAFKVPNAPLQQLADDFNRLYEGQITVTITTDLTSQEGTMLRIQDSPAMIQTSNNYYSIADVMSVAGIEFSNDDYYEGASRECMVNGVMKQLPVWGRPAYIVYNRSLMQKYGGRALPSNYTQLSEVLQAAYAGESASNPQFRSILSNNGWSYSEAPSYAAFIQNDADYYVYEDGYYVNKWEGEVFDRAVEAMQITYDLFGAEGDCHGNIGYSGNADPVNAVAAGNALMTLITWPADNESRIAADSNLDVMPVSGLFTDDTGEKAMGIPVHTFGFGFYRHATAVSPVQMCAGALFADYVAKNAFEFVEHGMIPLGKDAAQNAAYADSDDAVTNLLKKAAPPENLYTIVGNLSIKSIINTTAAEGFILPILEGDGSNIVQEMERLRIEILRQAY